MGSTGLLGQALTRELKSRKLTVTGIARSNADVCLDATNADQLTSALDTTKPDVVINAAAIVNLAKCEETPKQANAVNADISKTLSGYSSKNNIKYVFISTDHYYSGDTDKKHAENKPLELRNQYAKSKREGELFALENDKALVVRTNIVGFRNNNEQPTFVEWAITALKNQSPIELYTDFYTSSIDVTNFSRLLIDLIKKDVSGIINLASSEVSNKEKFVLKLAEALNLSTINTTRTSLLEQKSSIDRNESLGLDVSNAERILNRKMPNLDEVLSSLKNEYLKMRKHDKI